MKPRARGRSSAGEKPKSMPKGPDAEDVSVLLEPWGLEGAEGAEDDRRARTGFGRSRGSGGGARDVTEDGDEEEAVEAQPLHSRADRGVGGSEPSRAEALGDALRRPSPPAPRGSADSRDGKKRRGWRRDLEREKGVVEGGWSDEGSWVNQGRALGSLKPVCSSRVQSIV